MGYPTFHSKYGKSAKAEPVDLPASPMPQGNPWAEVPGPEAYSERPVHGDLSGAQLPDFGQAHIYEMKAPSWGGIPVGGKFHYAPDTILPMEHFQDPHMPWNNKEDVEALLRQRLENEAAAKNSVTVGEFPK